ncbi:DUF3667 domain-containing protein [Chitinophaga sp. SYP-B3965]|uniref:DUF3667 domain-containing protein n=1 Tax=Chitinophaga sp. SYP-B3965 TaxID=2663120 RepID=UPI001299AF62
MKTQHLRKDKTCLNCGTEVPDRFCSHCGQENVETKESFGHLIGHFFQDITHYDSKFLLTFKYLFTRPGLLTKKYTDGHRMDYVNPIRLYVFTSFVFFLVFGIVNHADDKDKIDSAKKLDASLGKTAKKLEERKAVLLDSIAMGAKDSLHLKENLERIESLKEELKNLELTSIFFANSETPVETGLARYDSLQKALPEPERDGFVKRYLMKHSIKMKYDAVAQQKALSESLTHNFPKVMFILLPFFALLLKWAYFRRKMFYSEHAIFSIHIHTFIFLLSLVAMLLNLLLHYDNIYAWMFLIVYIYFIIALRQFYGGSIWKAILKSLLILISYFIGAIIIMLFFVIIVAAFSV